MSEENNPSVRLQVESVDHSSARVRVSENVVLYFRTTKQKGTLVDSDLSLSYSGTPSGVSYYSVKESAKERKQALRAARVAINKIRRKRKYR